VPTSLGCADPPLPEHGAVGVVVERRRQPEACRNDLAQGKIDPAKVRREEDYAFFRVERSRGTNTYPDDFSTGYLTPRALDRLIRERRRLPVISYE